MIDKNGILHSPRESPVFFWMAAGGLDPGSEQAAAVVGFKQGTSQVLFTLEPLIFLVASACNLPHW